MIRRPPRSTLLSLHDALPIYTAGQRADRRCGADHAETRVGARGTQVPRPDRKSTRLNSSHTVISYAVFCLKKKKNRKPAFVLGAIHFNLAYHSGNNDELLSMI